MRPPPPRRNGGEKINKDTRLTIDPERMEFLKAAMSHYTVDLPKRMAAIKDELTSAADRALAPDAIIALLEELMDIVENLDFAKDFSSIGGLPALLGLLQHPDEEVSEGFGWT